MRRYIATVALILLAWEASSLLVDKPYLPPFSQVALRLINDSQIYLQNLAATLGRVFTSTIVALVAGLSAGLAATWLPDKLGTSILKSAILLTYPIPHVALLPVLLHIFSIESSKIVLMSLIAFYPVALSVMEWAQRFPRELAALIYTMGGGRVDVVRYVVIPSSLPGIITGLKIALNTAYSVSFIAESLVLTDGVGALIYNHWHRLDFVGMWAGIVTLAAAGIATYFAMTYIERKILKWV
ncbi:MAG: ABC transporter permease subunit [Pyrobaculum sp.]